MRQLAILAALAALAGSAAAQAPAEPSAAQPAGSAAAALKAMQEILQAPPRPKSMEEVERIVRERLPKVLAALEEMEKRHPKAPELHQAREIGLWASDRLARMNHDAAMAKRCEAIAQRVLKSDAPAEAKLGAEYHMLALTIAPVGKDAKPAANAVEIIRGYVQRHEKTQQAAEALKRALNLARVARQRELFQELLDRLVQRHPDDPLAKYVLAERQADKIVGQPFQAELTRLDGTKLKLPEGLLGKVVVVDFWATWCGPCVAEVPHMKAVYAKYKPKGVEIVGISLDNDRQALEGFVKAREMNWIHTYSGRPEGDPTAEKYGVRGIPSIWVVGKDGKVVSRDARMDLEETIEKALAAPATQPATQAKPSE